MKYTFLIVLLATPLLSCPGSDEYCLYCMEDTCASCAMTYLKDKTCTEPTTKIDNCVEYKNSESCESCDLGYQVSTNEKSCTAITIDECAALDPTDSTKCLMCEDGKKNDPATGKCTDVDCDKTNCKMCHVAAAEGVTVEVCGWCNDGYSAQDGSCITAPTANCLMASGGKCVSCTPGYYWKNGECAESTKYSWSADVKIYAYVYMFFSFVLF